MKQTNKQITEKHFFFKASGENICATIVCPKDEVPPSILFLHGAGPSNRHRIAYLANALAEQGLSSLRFDFPGHGESTGELKRGSLAQRINIALAATQYLSTLTPITIIGTSMGGHVAAELTKHVITNNLVLFCPAAYGAKAVSVEFGSGFTEIIRSPESWNDSPAFDAIQEFRGRFLFVIGEKDDIIPEQVRQSYHDSAINTAEKVMITVPDAPHAIHAWFEKDELQKEKIINTIFDFLMLKNQPI